MIRADYSIVFSRALYEAMTLCFAKNDASPKTDLNSSPVFDIVHSTPNPSLPNRDSSVKQNSSKKSFINPLPALTKCSSHLKYGTFSFRIFIVTLSTPTKHSPLLHTDFPSLPLHASGK